MIEVRIPTEGRAHTYAELTAPEGIDDQLAGAALAVDAVLAIGEGLFDPLAVNIELACCDTEFGLPLIDPQPGTRFHQLRLAAPPDTVAIPEIWEELLVSETERLDRAAILGWLGRLFAGQQCPEEDTRPGWAELIVGAVRARLPEAAGRGVEGGELPVSAGAGMIRYPVQRADDDFWVAGPLSWSTNTSPFEVRIVNEGGGLSLDWARHWSPWIEVDGGGRPDVEAAVRRISALGWEVRPGHPA